MTFKPGKCSVYDPYEKLNRKIFAFNSVVDTFLLRPVAKIYGRFTNDYTKNRVGSFVDNISEPLSTVNYTLQGNPEGILKSIEVVTPDIQGASLREY
ncbi:MAG: hypothetical protein EBR08_01380 [Bacteroidia bacterium]|nr:hypothetical protein [Bacteroidia bacterium]